MATPPTQADKMAGGEEDLRLRIEDAAERRQPLQIVGGNSKAFYGRAVADELEKLETRYHRGIVSYEPTELVVTARAGTPVAEVSEALADKGQCLPFEPPLLEGQATVGGSVACGLSGPARPYSGSARDYVLGMHVINGRAELLRVGGQVMKNVAGYDVSRLMVGALGTLGLITQVSFKVLPLPRQSITLAFHLDRDDALVFMNDLACKPTPLSASCFYEDILYIRLSGSESGVQHARKQLGGDLQDGGETIWSTLQEWQHPFFQSEGPLWRIALPALAAPALEGDVLIEWGGGQWWLRSEQSGSEIRHAVNQVGGHATLFRGGDRTGEVFTPLPLALGSLHERIRYAFDPLGLFNPGRQYQHKRGDQKPAGREA